MAILCSLLGLLARLLGLLARLLGLLARLLGLLAPKDFKIFGFLIWLLWEYLMKVIEST